VVLRECGDDPAQSWSRDTDSRLYAAALDDAFLDAPGETTSAALPVVVSAPLSPVAPSQGWVFDGVHVVNDGGLCLDIPDGDFKKNAMAQIYECHTGAEQSWSIDPLGRIRHETFCIDLPDGDTSDGTFLQLWECNDPVSDNQRFLFDGGRLRPLGAVEECVNVLGDPTANKSNLELAPCDESGAARPTHQSFRIHGPIRSLGLCLTALSDADGSVELQPCDDGDHQIWDWYF